MAITEARKALPQLVKQMSAKPKASGNLMDDAVDIGAHRNGGAVLLPEVDVAGHAAEIAKLRAQVEQLEEDLEHAAMALFVQQRIATTSGSRLTAERFLVCIGMEAHAGLLPRR
jgi:hypothetical protein